MENLPTLNGATNFSFWVKRVSEYVLAKYGEIASAIENPKCKRPDYKDLYVEPIARRGADITDRDIALAKQANELAAERCKTWLTQQPKVFGVILQTLSPEFKALIVNHVDYLTAKADGDVLSLMSIIRTKCGTSSANIASVVRQTKARMAAVRMESMNMETHLDAMMEMFSDIDVTGIVKLATYDKIDAILVSIEEHYPEIAEHFYKAETFPSNLVDFVEEILRLYRAQCLIRPKAETVMISTRADDSPVSSCNFCTQVLKKKGVKHSLFNQKGQINCRNYAKHLASQKGGESSAMVGSEKVASNVDESSLSVYNLNKEDLYLSPTKPTAASATPTNTEKLRRNDMIFDTGCSSHWFNDKTLFKSLTPCNTRIEGVGGVVKVTQRGMTPLGMAYFGNTKFNLVSSNQIHRDNRVRKANKRIKIAYHGPSNKFSVRLPDNKRLVFKPHPELKIPSCSTRLLKDKPIAMASTGNLNVPEAVPINPRVMDKAKDAYNLHVKLNHPSDEQLCRTLKNGGLTGTTVTANDVMQARKIYGICPACSAGKSTNITTGGQYNVATRVGQHLHNDVVYVPTTKGKSALFHITSDEFCTDIRCTPINDQTAPTLERIQTDIINHYSLHGHSVEVMYYDDGSNIKATESHLNGLGVRLVQAPANVHDKHAENAFRNVKMSMRSVLSSLEYKLPLQLLRYLVQDVCATRSMVTTRNSGHLSPYQIVRGGDAVDASKVLKYSFGTLIQFHDESHNDALAPRISYGLIVGRDLEYQGKMIIWTISTRAIVHRHVDGIQTVDMDDGIKAAINRLYDEDPYLPDDVLMTKTLAAKTRFNPRRDIIIEHHREAKRANSKNRTGLPKLKLLKPTKEPRHEYDTAEYRESDRAERLRQRNAKDAETHDVSSENDQPSQSTPAPDTAHDTTYEGNRDQPNVDISAHAFQSAYTHSKDIFAGLPAREIAIAMMILGRNAHCQNVQRQTHNEAAMQGLTLNQMLNQPDGHESAVKEIKQILDRETWHPRHANTLTSEQKRHAISCHGVGKVKRDGTKKTRLVAGGHRQDKSKYLGMTSPTSSHLTTMLHLTVAAYEKRPHLSQIDYPGAYLGIDRHKHSMPTEIMRVSGKLAELITTVDPTYKEYISENGSFYVELDKSLYGLVESAALWYKELTEQLMELGYHRSLVDPCLFHAKQSTINIHVDDLLCSFADTAERDRVHAYFRSKDCTIHEDALDFLHMRIQHLQDGSITLDMEEYISSHLKSWGVNNTSPYPANKGLFNINDMSPPADNPKRFVSIVMALMYLALRARPDILLAVSFLSTRGHVCTLEDEEKLHRVLGYLNHTKHLRLTIRPANMNILTLADASYNVHADAKGQNGYAITIGSYGSLIAAKSCKQKPVSKSSCEAELIAADLSTAPTIQASQTLAEFGYQTIPVLGQDNEGTIALSHNGAGNFKKTKHINTRYFSIKNLLDTNQLDIRHIRTDDMPADMLTKPLTGKRFIEFRNKLMNIT